MEVVARGVVIAHQAEQRGGQHAEQRRPRAAQEREQLVAVGGAGDVDAAPGGEAGEPERDRRDVRADVPGRKMSAGVSSSAGDGAGDHPAERFVRVRDALRFAGAAGGEEDERDGVAARRRQG